MKTDKLCELTLDNDTPHLDEWPADDQRAAAIELFEQDERQEVPGNYPDWIGDCMIEGIATNETDRLAIIAALKHDSAVARHAALGVILERALVTGPRDALTQVALENMLDWEAERRRDAAEAAYDSRREARA